MLKMTDSHKYVETNGKSAVTAMSDNIGNSVLTLIQKIQAANASLKRIQQILVDNLERGFLCPVLVLDVPKVLGTF